jgi:hypothetical protein
MPAALPFSAASGSAVKCCRSHLIRGLYDAGRDTQMPYRVTRQTQRSSKHVRINKSK